MANLMSAAAATYHIPIICNTDHGSNKRDCEGRALYTLEDMEKLHDLAKIETPDF